jgi:hypothetical protein
VIANPGISFAPVKIHSGCEEHFYGLLKDVVNMEFTASNVWNVCEFCVDKKWKV